MDAISDHDRDILGIVEGDCASQQALECLATVVGLRIWAQRWQRARCVVRVRGDNITMLSLVGDMTARSPAVVTLAREYALMVAAANYHPVEASHTPGVSNSVADRLSRRWEPAKPWALPELLASATRVAVPQRDASWYAALTPPAARSALGQEGQSASFQ